MKQGNPNRILAIDLARGVAVSLMILSHGIKGLLSFEQFPQWGLVPIHLITKFSSTVFFMTFGLSLAVAFAPATENTEFWPQKRNKLLLRGLTILFWYKVLTVIEMSHLHNPREIFDALIYRDFPSYAEILGFYALALLWFPFLLPVWQRSSRLMKALWPLGFGILSLGISRYVDFGGSQQIKALLVEDSNFYTWGQISRAPLVFLGMFLGSFLINNYSNFRRRFKLSGILAGIAALLFTTFMIIYNQELYSTFEALALNEGKHPPELAFLLFSLSGAFGIFAITFFIGDKGAKWLAPFTLIGKDTLSAFIFHLTVLFIFYRYLFDLWLKVSYPEAMALTILLMGMTALWIKFKVWRKQYEEHQVPSGRHAHPRNLKPRELSAN